MDVLVAITRHQQESFDFFYSLFPGRSWEYDDVTPVSDDAGTISLWAGFFSQKDPLEKWPVPRPPSLSLRQLRRFDAPPRRTADRPSPRPGVTSKRTNGR